VSDTKTMTLWTKLRIWVTDQRWLWSRDLTKSGAEDALEIMRLRELNARMLGIVKLRAAETHGDGCSWWDDDDTCNCGQNAARALLKEILG
jgi:hypothetical protein